MAFWPFARRKHKPKSNNHSKPSSSSSDHNAPSTPKTPRRHSKRRKNRDAPAGDACVPPRQILTPSPIDIPTARGNLSQHSLGQLGANNDVPTLHHKRNSADPVLVRRKSSKRKRHDSSRELEIKNMAAYDRCSTPDSHCFQLSVFDALSPRPVLRYAEPPRSPPTLAKGKSPVFFETHNLNGRHRINELADQMDAGTLRELMDRDRRRRAARKSAMNTDSPKRTRTPPAAAVPAAPNPEPMDLTQMPSHSASWLHDPSKDSLGAAETEQQTRSIATVPEAPAPIDTKQPQVTDADTASLRAEQEMGSISDISRTHRSDKPRSSNTGRIGRSLSSIFRRGSRFGREPRRPLKDLPSFSVPSRESFAKISHTELPPAIPKKSSLRFDGQSMRSRFTEHFDETTSPDHIHSSSAIDIYPSSNRISVCTGRGTVTTAATNDLPESLRPSGANSPDTRPNSMFLAHSLASIDSEGSWLSGKPSRRLSQARTTHHRSNAESRERLDELDDPEPQDDRPASEEVFGLLGGGTVPEEDEEAGDAERIPQQQPNDDEATTWHRGIGKRAHLVSPRAPRAKSKEGLFTNFLESSSDINDTPEADSPLLDEGDMEVRRATSVDLGKGHIRHISAGSAKLLDLPPRLSEERRPSAATMSSGVLPSMAASDEEEEQQQREEK